jgi:hypothetical protein
VRLREVDLAALAAELAPDERFSLFVNLYNALVLHATCALGPPQDSPESRTRFFRGRTGATYDIGGLSFSLDDIEHGILRANAPHPSSPADDAHTYFDPGDVRTALAMPRLDPRLHFILNCGASSCPPISILGYGDPDPALRAAAAAYLADEVAVDASRRALRLPRLAMWYAADFGSSIDAQIAALVRMCGPAHKAVLQEGLTALGYQVADVRGYLTDRDRDGDGEGDEVGDVDLDKKSALPFTVEYGLYDWTSNAA